MSLTKTLLKTSVVSTFSRFIGVGLNYAVILVLTNTLPIHDSGMVLLLMVLIPTAALVSRLGVEQWLVREVARLADSHISQQAGYLRAAYRLVLLSSAGVMVLWWLSIPLLRHYWFDGAVQALSLALAATGIVLFNVIMLNATFLKAVQHTSASLLIQNSLPAISFLLLIGLFWQTFQENQAALWLYSASLVLASLASWVWLRPWWKALFAHNHVGLTLREVWQQSLPLAPVSILAFLLLWADTLMTGWLLSNHEVALYNVAARLSFISLFFLGALDASIYPRLLKVQQYQPQYLKRFFWQATALVAVLLGAITLALVLLGDTLLTLFKPEYTQAVTVLSVLLIAQFIRALSLTFGFMFIMQDKVRYLNSLLAFALLVAIIAHLLLIPRYGIEGAALATLLANTVLTGGTVGLFIRLRLLTKTRVSVVGIAC